MPAPFLSYADFKKKTKGLDAQKWRSMFDAISTKKDVLIYINPDVAENIPFQELKNLFESIPENVSSVLLFNNKLKNNGYPFNHFDLSQQEALIAALLKSNPKRKLQLSEPSAGKILGVGILSVMLLAIGIGIYTSIFTLGVFPLATLLIGVVALGLTLIPPLVGAIYDWVAKKRLNAIVGKAKDKLEPVSSLTNIASKLNVTKDNLNNAPTASPQPLNESKVTTNKRLFALDFDETITKSHTFQETQLANVPLVPGRKKVFGIPLFKEEKAGQPDFAFKHSKTDQAVIANLRNREQTKALIQDILADDCLIIVTRHDNIEWVKRNLRLLLNDASLADRIEVYALQNPKYDKYSNKLAAMHGHVTKLESDPKQPIKIEKAYLIDNDSMECENLKLRLERQKENEPTKFQNITAIHADEKDPTNAYLGAVREILGKNSALSSRKAP